MKHTFIIPTILLIFLTQNSTCFLQDQNTENPILTSSSEYFNYKEEMNKAFLNVGNDDGVHEHDISQWLGNYSVGKQCSSGSCEMGFLFHQENSMTCPKSENTAVIGYNSHQNKYYVSFYAYWPLSSKTPFLATFDDSYRVKTREGYKYKIPLQNGIDLNIEPCYYGRNRDSRFHICPSYPQYPEIVVYKTYSSIFKDSSSLKKCAFTLTRYYGYNKHCQRNAFLNILKNFGEDLIFA